MIKSGKPQNFSPVYELHRLHTYVEILSIACASFLITTKTEEKLNKSFSIQTLCSISPCDFLVMSLHYNYNNYVRYIII